METFKFVKLECRVVTVKPIIGLCRHDTVTRRFAALGTFLPPGPFFPQGLLPPGLFIPQGFLSFFADNAVIALAL
jgi:hypothetical protein